MQALPSKSSCSLGDAFQGTQTSSRELMIKPHCSWPTVPRQQERETGLEAFLSLVKAWGVERKARQSPDFSRLTQRYYSWIQMKFELNLYWICNSKKSSSFNNNKNQPQTHMENHLFHLYCLHAEQTNTDEGGKCIRAAEKIELENTILSAFPKVTNTVEWCSISSQGSLSSGPGLM